MNLLTKWKVMSVFGILVLMTVSGCTVMSSGRMKPNSHFAYPNSNVTPIGPANGKTSTISLMAPTPITGALMEEAYKQALAKSGGDMIIDAVEVSNVRLIWLYVSIFYTTFEVDGTAAKMELGQQNLK